MDPVGILRATSLFADLRVDEVGELRPVLQERSYDRGQTVWIEGDRAEDLFVVGEGQLKSHRVSREGREVILLVHTAVTTTGEVGLFHPSRKRWVSLTAMTPARCLTIRRAHLLAFLSRHPPAMERMFEQLSVTAVRAAYSFSGVVFDDIGRRVASTLLHLADADGEETPEGVRIRPRLSQADLAAHVAASRENVNRALAALLAGGVVSHRGRHFYVHDRAALQDIVFRDAY